jgi:selenide,water dikinase
MTALNRRASRAALGCGVRSATDVTGFGLLGHASHLARGSGVTLVIDPSVVPRLPGVDEILAAGIRTGGAERNDQYLGPLVDWRRTSDSQRALMVDPQTSGGLLVACPAGRVVDYLAAVPGAVAVGRVENRREHLIVLE